MCEPGAGMERRGFELREGSASLLETLSVLPSPLDAAGRMRCRVLPVFLSPELATDEGRSTLLQGHSTSNPSYACMRNDGVVTKICVFFEPNASIKDALLDGRMKTSDYQSKLLKWSHQLLTTTTFFHSSYILIGELTSADVDLIEPALVANTAYRELGIDLEETVVRPNVYQRDPSRMTKEVFINPLVWCDLASRRSSPTASAFLQRKTAFPLRCEVMLRYQTHSVGVFEIDEKNIDFASFKKELNTFTKLLVEDLRFIGALVLELMSNRLLSASERATVMNPLSSFAAVGAVVDCSRFPPALVKVLRCILASVNDPLWLPKISVDNRVGRILKVYSFGYFEALHTVIEEFHAVIVDAKSVTLAKTLRHIERDLQWTKEDELLRLRAKEEKREQARRQAEEGHRRAQLRVRDEQYQNWLSTQPPEVQRRILRRNAARERAVKNQGTRRLLLHAALFHTWDEAGFREWLSSALCRDLAKQFKAVRALARTRVLVASTDSRSATLAVDVVRGVYSSLCAVILNEAEADILRVLFNPPEEGDELPSPKPLSYAESKRSLHSSESETSLESRKLRQLEPLFALLSRLLASKLGLCCSARGFVKSVLYASNYAKIKVDADEMAASLSAEQYAMRKRLAELEVFRATFLALDDAAAWLARVLGVPDEASSEWRQTLRTWSVNALVDAYYADSDSREEGEAVAASKVVAVCRGFKSRAFVARVWRLADEELLNMPAHLHIEDVVETLLVGRDSSAKEGDAAAEISTEEDDLPPAPLRLHKAVPLSAGFKLHVSKTVSFTEIQLLQKVGICVGYITKEPEASEKCTSSGVCPGLMLRRPALAWPSSSKTDSMGHGEVVLLIIDSRKNFNFPFGSPCDASIEWSDTRSSDLWCVITVLGLRPFSSYRVTLKVDTEPMSDARPLLGELPLIDRRPVVFSFKADLVYMFEVSLRTGMSVPSVPKHIEAEVEDAKHTFEVLGDGRKVGVRLNWSASDANGSTIIKYELQRMVSLTSPLGGGASAELNVWSALVTIAPSMALSFFDSSLAAPFVVQYRVRAISDIGDGPFASSLDITSDDVGTIVTADAGLQLLDIESPLGRVYSAGAPIRKGPKSRSRAVHSTYQLNDLVGVLVGSPSRGVRKEPTHYAIDEGWLRRLADASPFGKAI